MENGIIKPVQVPTDWTSAMVVVRKQNGKIRLCIDPKPLNRALKGNHHPLPTIDDLLPKLVQAKVFGVLDAKNEERREKRAVSLQRFVLWGTATDGLGCPSVFRRQPKNSSGS